jgi:hypothetical protein
MSLFTELLFAELWPLTPSFGPQKPSPQGNNQDAFSRATGESDMAFNGDTKMGVMLDDPVARAVLVKFLPQIETAGPMLKMARGMTLKQVAGFPQAKIPPEKLQAIIVELEKL